jgi:hypothetical protein
LWCLYKFLDSSFFSIVSFPRLELCSFMCIVHIQFTSQQAPSMKIALLYLPESILFKTIRSMCIEMNTEPSRSSFHLLLHRLNSTWKYGPSFSLCLIQPAWFQLQQSGNEPELGFQSSTNYNRCICLHIFFSNLLQNYFSLS